MPKVICTHGILSIAWSSSECHLLKYVNLSFEGRRKPRSQSVQAHTALNQRPPASSHSGPIAESRQPFIQTSTSAHEIAQRLSSSQLSFHNSATSVFSQSPAVPVAGQLTVQDRAAAMLRSSLASSTSSTLSLLFGKRSFSSALVISGLSAADGGNTSDTQSSSSMNIAMGPSARAASQAARVRLKRKEQQWAWVPFCSPVWFLTVLTTTRFLPSQCSENCFFQNNVGILVFVLDFAASRWDCLVLVCLQEWLWATDGEAVTHLKLQTRAKSLFLSLKTGTYVSIFCSPGDEYYHSRLNSSFLASFKSYAGLKIILSEQFSLNSALVLSLSLKFNPRPENLLLNVSQRNPVRNIYQRKVACPVIKHFLSKTHKKCPAFFPIYSQFHSYLPWKIQFTL